MENLQARELRLFNYVECFGIRQIASIQQLKVKVFHENDGVTYSEECPINSDALKPIPLTEEWLLKFGFEKTVYKFLSAYYLSINVLSHGQIASHVTEKGFKIDLGTVTGYQFGTTEIKFVHQLQNLFFALTDEELKLQTHDPQDRIKKP